MIGGGVIIDLRQGAFLGADGPGEVAEVVHRQGQVRVQGFTDRLAVVPGFGDRQHFQVLLDAVRDLVQDDRPFGDTGPAPRRGGGMCGVQRQFDVFGGGAGHLTERFAGDRGDVLEVHALDRGHPLAPDVILVARLERDQCAVGVRVGVNTMVVLLLRGRTDAARGGSWPVRRRRARGAADSFAVNRSCWM